METVRGPSAHTQQRSSAGGDDLFGSFTITFAAAAATRTFVRTCWPRCIGNSKSPPLFQAHARNSQTFAHAHLSLATHRTYFMINNPFAHTAYVHSVPARTASRRGSLATLAERENQFKYPHFPHPTPVCRVVRVRRECHTRRNRALQLVARTHATARACLQLITTCDKRVWPMGSAFQIRDCKCVPSSMRIRRYTTVRWHCTDDVPLGRNQQPGWAYLSDYKQL